MKTKGTILYIGGFELPDKNAAAHRVIANGKLLKNLGYNVVFCGVTQKQVPENSTIAKEYFGFDSYELSYPKSSIDWLKFIFQANFYKKLTGKYNDTVAVICYNLPSGSLSRMIGFCGKKDIKIISDCTEWYEAPKGGNFIYRNVKKLDITMRMFTLHLKMDGIISISEYLHKFYTNKGMLSVKIPPLVDLTDSKWKYLVVKKSKPVKLVYSGSPFSLAKNANAKDRLDLIVQSFYELAQENYNFFLNIVGISKDEFLLFFPDLQNAILGLEKKIKFHGRVPHAASLSILKESDFSIFIRDANIVTKAGFPTKFVESVSLGIPVVTNNNSNVIDYLMEGKNGFLLEVKEPSKLTEKLKLVVHTSEDDILKMKQYCQESKIFDFRNFKQRTKQFLDEI
ncbi:MAG: glycosyltransferase involved in cell wall biosynthesis [Polaribacter sp.]|jgi:glycosyltransferase involved in cell wall biosynthesis